MVLLGYKGDSMKISTKGRYSIIMLVDLAQHLNSGYISLRDIAARQNISKKYLEQIVPVLIRGGIVSTNRGYNGGYRLSLSPEKCTVGKVLRLTEGSLSSVSQYEDDTTCFVWKGLDEAVNNYLDSITIQSILDNIVQSYSYVI